MKNVKLLACIYVVSFLGACNKSDDTVIVPDPSQEEQQQEQDNEDDLIVLKGIFQDAPVQGLSYETDTQTGVTSATGEFEYVAGETITFKIGNVTLGTAPGQEVITPITLAQTLDENSTIESKTAWNIAALLQTLDQDGDDSNGIQIETDVAQNMGVTSIDFNQPIEAVLTDIMLNVADKTGKVLTVVYPSEAAVNMAQSLGVQYAPEPDFVITHFMPFLRGFYADQAPPSVIYKHYFNASGLIEKTDAILRYSGRTVRTFQYSGHGADGQPTELSYYFEGGLFKDYGTNPPGYDTMGMPTRYTLTYNEEHYVSTLQNSDFQWPEIYTFFEFNGDNFPIRYELSSNQQFDGGTFIFTYGYESVFNEGVLQSMSSTYNSEYNSSDSNSSLYSVNASVGSRAFTYDDKGNFATENVQNRRENTRSTNGGQPVLTVYEHAGEATYSYTNGIMTVYNYTGTFSNNGETIPDIRNETFDANGLISTATTEYGTFTTESTYKEGQLASTTSFNNGLKDSERTFEDDGTFEELNYSYDENNVLVGIYKYSYVFLNGDQALILGSEEQLDANGNSLFGWDYEYNSLGLRSVVRFYQEGSLYETYQLEYDANGSLTKETAFDPQGTITSIWFYTDGTLTRQDNYFEGSYDSYYLFQYNENGTWASVDLYRTNDTLWIIYYYDENGNYIYYEEYDEQGNLIYTDNTGAKKPSIKVRKSMGLPKMKPLPRNVGTNTVTGGNNLRYAIIK